MHCPEDGYEYSVNQSHTALLPLHSQLFRLAIFYCPTKGKYLECQRVGMQGQQQQQHRDYGADDQVDTRGGSRSGRGSRRRPDDGCLCDALLEHDLLAGYISRIRKRGIGGGGGE